MNHTKRDTINALTTELEEAIRSGKPAEIADLRLLILSTESKMGGKGALPGHKEASNRQAQRRYHRRWSGALAPSNPDRLDPVVGDFMTCPDMIEYEITEVAGDTLWSRVKGTTNCHRSQVVSIRKAGSETSFVHRPNEVQHITPEPVVDPRTEAFETLYHALWDVLETSTGDDWREALEAILRASEATLA